MTFAAAALIGLTMGQPLGPDYYPMNSRTIKLPIEYKKDRKTIRHVALYVARNGENTWTREGFVTPDQDAFVYVAKDDGVYWFKMQIEDLKGNKDPADLTRDPPDLKMVVDTVAPVVRVTNAKRTGDEIVIEWSIDDKFPNDAETKVSFRASNNPNALWQEVTLPAASRTGVKFPSGIADGVTVKISAVDIAGNKTEITREFAGNGGASTSLKEQPPYIPAPGPDGKGNGLQSLPPPPDLGAPIMPNPPVKTEPVAPIKQPDPVVAQPFKYPPPVENPAMPLVSNPPHTGGPQPLATFDAKAPPTGSLPAHGTATPAAWNSAPPAVEVTRAFSRRFGSSQVGIHRL